MVYRWRGIAVAVAASAAWTVEAGFHMCQMTQDKKKSCCDAFTAKCCFGMDGTANEKVCFDADSHMFSSDDGKGGQFKMLLSHVGRGKWHGHFEGRGIWRDIAVSAEEGPGVPDLHEPKKHTEEVSARPRPRPSSSWWGSKRGEEL
eukprot:TRINITY_DN23042_c0_g1_i1.p1 TRINITY_DN23042_c0_g1~~TRINITY_DN23042_c0_g1_i1.p1  ORF type:complete len:146 (+),score=25.87 TRINITY_DN23042_c0_g1_i1:70-507(+)